ncbi:MAG: hypothetical protein ACXVH3_39350, partial [Solirubrobacteraceae bacterium]
SAALAASTPAGGAVKVFVTPTSGPRSSILVTGAIGDYGKTLRVDKNGKTAGNGDYQKVTLKQGSFEVNATALNKKLNASAPVVNKTTCSLVFSGSAPTTVFNGTGLYKGISGTVRITVTFAGIAPRYTSGTHKGQCNFSNSAQPLGQYQAITGTGSVHFS